ncbi:hypothetical protein JCM1393_28430 [Clostridium carnis]
MNDKRKKLRRKMMIRRRITAMTVAGLVVGLVIYTPIKIKHKNLLQLEAKATERFSGQMSVVEDYKNLKENKKNIYTSDEKIAEIQKLEDEISNEISNGITDNLNKFVSDLKALVSEVSASNEVELEAIFNKINEDKLEGFTEEEIKKVNSFIDDYDGFYKERNYKSAKDTLSKLQGYINDIKKDANQRRIKKTYDLKSSEDASKREAKYINGILLVNKEYGLPDSFAPGESAEARAAFEEMKAKAASEGVYLNAFSTYRSYWSQNRLYWNYASNYGQEPTDTFSARAGFSEHQTGLAFDIGGADRSLWAENAFKNTIEAKWLKDNAYKYGFILRYPEGKEWKTGFIFESWHFRYIGKEHSKNFANNDLTLEEYLGL